VEKEGFTLEEMMQLMVEKLKLISNMHSFVLEIVDQTQKRHAKAMVHERANKSL
jgi:hypothetical protein